MARGQIPNDFDVIEDYDSDFDELPDTGDWPQSMDQCEGTSNLFSKLYEGQLNFGKSSFLPGFPVMIQITNVQRSQSCPKNPYLYEIEVTHANFTWKIMRRYNHLCKLHYDLKWLATASKLPLTKKLREVKQSIKQTKERKKLPRLPRLPESQVTDHMLEERKVQLERYLRDTLAISIYKNSREMMDFLEVSPFSFIDQLGIKGREGVVRKRSGGRVPVPGCVTFGNMFSDFGIWNWTQRWLLVKETYLMYVQPSNGEIRTVMLMDRGFRVVTNVGGSKSDVLVCNSSRNLELKCWTKRKAEEWASHILSIAGEKAAQAFIKSNRYLSFAPVRDDTLSKWFIDGASYFRAVAETIERAEEEVFITGWWLSPEIYLRRPVIHGDLWRLDEVLLRKASQGIRIFILLYKELQMALGIGSLYSKQHLMRHPNVKVLRHPDAVKGGTILWSHHEKTVIVDQSIAFVGGIDLCYGRWDTKKHKLTDLGGIHLSDGTETINLAYTLTSPTEVVLPKSNLTKKPSQDPIPETAGMGIKLVKFEQSRDFIVSPVVEERPSNSRFKRFQRIAQAAVRLHRLRKKSVDSLAEFDPVDGISAGSTTQGEIGAKLWFGKDYINFIVRDILEVERPYGDLVNRNTTPRMPWHDVSMAVIGASARDVARHFIERWNFTKVEKAKFNPKYPYLLPKSYSNVSNVKHSFLGNFFKCKTQIVRSVSSWSIGIRVHEDSIYRAYIDTIRNSQRFIYIENQFLVTNPGNNHPIINRIGESIFERIMRAFKSNEQFRVYVLLPLLPCFEGEVGKNSGAAIQAVTNWNYKSICRGNNSIVGRLRNCGIEDPSEYISFFGLRNWSLLNGKLVTELIYVHSKILIADDMTCIIGSANINDRSMTGHRDSEVCAVIDDQEQDQLTIGEEHYLAGRFCGSLRRTLLKEHLGMSTMEMYRLWDGAGQNLYDICRNTAKRNSEVYEEVFGCIPSDNVKTFVQLRSLNMKPCLATSDPQRAVDLLRREIRGHLVLFPFHFLENENLKPAAGTKEFLVPETVWT